MTEISFHDYSVVKQSEPPTSKDVISYDSNIPAPDLDEWVSWEYAPVTRNRTYLDISESAIRENNINRLSTKKKHYPHKYLPNYKMMELNNRGLWKPNGDERKERLHPQDNWCRRHAIITQLDLTNSQKRRVMWLANTGEVKEASRGYSLDEITYCLCGIVGWEDGRSTHPSMKNRDDRFQTIETSLNLLSSRIQKVWGTLFAALDGLIERRRDS